MPRLSKAEQRVSVSANAVRLRKETALAEVRELEAAERAGRVIPADRVIQTWAAILGAVKAAVLGIPDRCALAVSSAKDPRAARAVLATECEAILRNLSDDVRKLSPAGNNGRGGRVDAPYPDAAGEVGERTLPTQ